MAVKSFDRFDQLKISE